MTPARSLFNILILISASSTALAGETSIRPPALSPYFYQQSLTHSVIINGKRSDTSNDSRRFTVHLQFGSKNLCTGVIIHEKIIATSAHCLLDEDATIEHGEVYRHKTVRVRFGFGEKDPEHFWVDSEDMVMEPRYFHHDDETGQEYFQSTPTKVVENAAQPKGALHISKTVPSSLKFYREETAHIKKQSTFFVDTTKYINTENPNKRPNAYDIGLIFLKDPIPSSKPFEPIAMITHHTELDHGDSYYITGFGISAFSTENGKIYDHLRSAGGTLQGYRADHVGGPKHGFYGFPTEERFACHGDSGGPMLVYVNGEPKLLAIYSYSEENCTGYQFGVSIGLHTRWIQQQMESEERNILDGLPGIDI